MLSRFAKRFVTDQHGFTMLMVVTALFAVSMLTVAAYSATESDIPVARADQQSRSAYEAAQAGVDWYAALLRTDPEMWMRCGGDSSDPWRPLTVEGTTPHTGWMNIATGTQATTANADQDRFRVEILKNGATSCNASTPFTTALDPKGYLRIRSTGAANGRARSVVAVFQQQSEFLNYLYFSNWEAQDPQLSGTSTSYPSGSNRNLCDYTRKTRDRTPNGLKCIPSTFQANDTLAGSVRTNDDSFYICNGASFGRDGMDDKLEVASPVAAQWNAVKSENASATPAYSTAENGWYDCTAPTLNAAKQFSHVTVNAKAEILQLPPNNVVLKDYAARNGAAHWPRLNGRACLKFTGGDNVDVYPQAQTNWGIYPTNIKCTGSPVSKKIPSGGVIYAENDPNVPCQPRYGTNSATSYTSSASCGDIAIEGTYGASVTIGAENDIIITGDLKREANTSALLGLVANGYVRIYHPLNGDPYLASNQSDGLSLCNKPGGGISEIPSPAFTPVARIDAAILSMQHTLQLDNMFCGTLPKLTVNGSVSVYWAAFNKWDPAMPFLPGWLKTLLGVSARGYVVRDWQYDGLLKTAQPPHFIAPLNSDGRWIIQRRTEQAGMPVRPDLE